MATDLTVILDDRAGQLAHMGEALGDAGVVIEGISATTSDGVGIVHVLVENAMVAQNALILADLEVIERVPGSSSMTMSFTLVLGRSSTVASGEIRAKRSSIRIVGSPAPRRIGNIVPARS